MTRAPEETRAASSSGGLARTLAFEQRWNPGPPGAEAEAEAPVPAVTARAEFATMSPVEALAAMIGGDGWQVLGSRVGYLQESVIARREIPERADPEYLVFPVAGWYTVEGEKVAWAQAPVQRRAEEMASALELVVVGTLGEVLDDLGRGARDEGCTASQLSALLELAPENAGGALDTLLALRGVLGHVHAYRADPVYRGPRWRTRRPGPRA